MFTVKFKGCPQVAVSSQILRLRVDSGRARRFDAPFTPGLLRRSNSRAAAVTGRARTGKGRWRSRPISRVLSWTVIPLGATSPLRSSSLPGPDAGRVMRSLFGLAPGGVCRAGLLPGSRCALTAPFHPCLIPRHPAAAFPEGTWPMLRIVRSPDWGRTGVARAIGGIFLLHFPSARAAQALPGTVPCGARTFLGIRTHRNGPMTRLSGRLRRCVFYGFAVEYPKVCCANFEPRSVAPNPLPLSRRPLDQGGLDNPISHATRSRTRPCAARRTVPPRVSPRSMAAGAA